METFQLIAKYAIGVFIFLLIVALVFGDIVIDFFSNVEDRIDSGTELG